MRLLVVFIVLTFTLGGFVVSFHSSPSDYDQKDVERIYEHHKDCQSDDWACQEGCRVEIFNVTDACRAPLPGDTCFGVPIRNNYTVANRLPREVEAFRLVPKCWKVLAPFVCETTYRPCSVHRYFQVGMKTSSVLEARKLMPIRDCLEVQKECRMSEDSGFWPFPFSCKQAATNLTKQILTDDVTCKSSSARVQQEYLDGKFQWILENVTLPESGPCDGLCQTLTVKCVLVYIIVAIPYLVTFTMIFVAVRIKQVRQACCAVWCCAYPEDEEEASLVEVKCAASQTSNDKVELNASEIAVDLDITSIGSEITTTNDATGSSSTNTVRSISSSGSDLGDWGSSNESLESIFLRESVNTNLKVHLCLPGCVVRRSEDDALMNPYHLALILAKNEMRFGMPPHLPLVRSFNSATAIGPRIVSPTGNVWNFLPQHVPLYFPDENLYCTSLTRRQLLDGCDEILASIHLAAGYRKENRFRFLFEALRDEALIIECTSAMLVSNHQLQNDEEVAEDPPF